MVAEGATVAEDEPLLKVEYLSFYWLVVFFVYYISYVYPLDFKLWFRRSLLYTAALFSLITPFLMKPTGRRLRTSGKPAYRASACESRDFPGTRWKASIRTPPASLIPGGNPGFYR